MGEEIGKVYVAKYFPPEAKAAADQLVKNIIAAMGARIDKLDWMAPETKAKAHEKPAAFTPKIGYPDTWRDYSALQITRDDLVGKIGRAHVCTPVTNAQLVCRPMLDTKNQYHSTLATSTSAHTTSHTRTQT